MNIKFERNIMNITQQRMTAIFNEWAKRYAQNPEEFSSILDDAGNTVTNYGENCTYYFEQLANEMDGANLLPVYNTESSRC